MNEKQRQKAIEVLSTDRLPSIEELKQEAAFNRQLWAIQMIDVYNLPYRVLLDYFKKNGFDYMKCVGAACKDGIVLINPLYPAPGYYKADIVCVDWYVDNKYTINPLIRIEEGPFKDDLTSNKFDLRTFIQEDTKLSEEIESRAAEQMKWDLSTAAGRKVWEFEFAHFLNAADLDYYSDSDWWGDKQTPPGNAADRINYWKSLQADYHMHSEKYRQEEPTCDNPEDYTLCKFYFDYRAFSKDTMM